MANAWRMAQFTAPRIVVALLGAGFFAELLPPEQVRALFGEGAGVSGVLLAIALGPITPGGAFVSFAVGAAALKAGATSSLVVTYVTSWSLFSASRFLAYELPLMGRQLALRRLLLCLPVPFLIAGAAHVV
jgi:uncharacterized membrane protein YraQ (UPF0718 family)